MNTLVFTYGPYFALFGFLAARMYRWGILRDRLAPAARAVSPAAEGALVLGFATLAVGHLATVLAPGAMRALLSDPDRVAVLETAGLVGALLFAWGVGARLARRAQAWRAGVAGQAGPAAVLALLLAVCLSGIYLSVAHRWITAWYAYIFVPYARSLVVLEPATRALTASPWAVQQHALLFMALAAAWPASGLPVAEVFPIHAVARRFGERAAAVPASGSGPAVPP
jgi:nitrate reductase gamma subunit